jgi:hypothetical protein
MRRPRAVDGTDIVNRALLGALSVSSDFNAAAQGAVLIALLAMRYLARSEAE